MEKRWFSGLFFASGGWLCWLLRRPDVGPDAKEGGGEMKRLTTALVAGAFAALVLAMAIIVWITL